MPAAGGSAVAAALDRSRALDTLTPDGPATVRENWLGGITMEGRPPEVLVGWKVTVGSGGNAGPVRLRVLRPGKNGTVVGSGPVERLPSTPGTYAFGLRPGIPYDYRDAGLALDQEIGGHAIVKTHAPEPEEDAESDPARLYAVDVFRPPLPDGARRVAYTERRMGQELLVRGIVETDSDEDRLGDKTQDVGDLRLLHARVAGRRGRFLLVRARVRNVGATVRDQAFIVAPKEAWGFSCPTRSDEFLRCPGRPLPPGGERTVGLLITGPYGPARNRSAAGRAYPPTRIEVASEGTDTNPADNAGPLTPRLILRASRRNGLRVSIAASHRGTVRVVARAAGTRIARSVRLRRPGRRTITLTRSKRFDKRGVTITATLRGARTTVGEGEPRGAWDDHGAAVEVERAVDRRVVQWHMAERSVRIQGRLRKQELPVRARDRPSRWPAALPRLVDSALKALRETPRERRDGERADREPDQPPAGRAVRGGVQNPRGEPHDRDGHGQREQPVRQAEVHRGER